MSTPYELQTGIPSSSPNSSLPLRELPGGHPATTGIQGTVDSPMRYADEWPTYGTHTELNDGQISAGPNVVDDSPAYPPSPVSANPRPATGTVMNRTTAMSTPGGEWTLVTGKPSGHAKPKSTTATTPVLHGTDVRSAVYLDKGKARGPPGPPSPPHPTLRHAPPISKLPEQPVDWRTAPRDFYHLGTDLAALKRPPPVDAVPAATAHERARQDARDNARREALGYREAKRLRRHSPVREEDPFVPSSKDLERMNAHGPEFPVWAATPAGGQSVRILHKIIRRI